MLSNHGNRMLLVLLMFSSIAKAQSPPENERPRLKNFGDSLKHQKWDPKKNADEKKRKSAAADPGEDEVVRVTTDLVVCDVQVRDERGKPVTGLNPADFIVTENGQPQTIEHFSLGSDRNVARTIVLLIDYSGSQASYIQTSVAAAMKLVDQLGPKDMMAIVTDDVALLADFTRDKARLKKALDSLRSKSANHRYGKSRQFSALMATIKEAFNPEDIRPIVIFQTDGDELFFLQPSVPQIFSIPDERPFTLGEKRSFSLRDVYRTIEKSRASVYTIIPSPRLIEGQTQRDMKSNTELFGEYKKREFEYLSRRRWEQLAAAGAAIGGWTAYLQKPEEADEIYANILEDINTRYVLGYYPTNKQHDGRRRNVVVEVKKHPEYVVSGRKSYIARNGDN